MATQYEKLGVESDKGHIKEEFSGVNKTEYPYAFVNIAKDPWDPTWVMTMHGDGSGSRSITHWLYYIVTGDDSLLKYDIADSIAMGADVVAGGFTGHLVIIDIIDINGNNIQKSIVTSNVAKGITETMHLLSNWGFNVVRENSQRGLFEEEGSAAESGIIIPQIHILGGETADLVDQLLSYSINACLFSRMPREGAIAGNVQPQDTIWGFSSGGQAIWEERPNSGHMSNGSTLSGPVLLSKEYQQRYPFLRTEQNAFRGPFKVDQHIRDLNMTVGEALLSPTRQWAIVMKMIIENAKADGCFDKLHAIVMNTGGGLTKCSHVGDGILYRKRIPEFLPIFRLIQQVSKETTLGMMKTFNCGIGLEVIGDNSDGRLGKIIAAVAEKTQIPFYPLGFCFPTGDSSGKNQVVVEYARKSYGPVWEQPT